MQTHAFSNGEGSFESRKRLWKLLDWVLVRSHMRSRPYMAWTGIRDVPIDEYVRRPPGWKKRHAA